jgi:hypothetical protein
VLIEPDHMAYGSIVQHLVVAEGSTYRLAKNIAEVFDQGKDLLPADQCKSATTNSKTINDDLLLVANLNSHVSSSGDLHFKGTLSKMFINTWVDAMFHRQNHVHQNGFVRMLAWLPKQENLTILSRSVRGRKAQTVNVEMAADATEVASGVIPEKARNLPLRHPYEPIELESQHNVKVKMSTGTNSSPDSQTRKIHPHIERRLAIANQQRVLDHEERTNTTPLVAIEECSKEILRRKRDLLGPQARVNVDRMIDDARAFDSSPPVLAWDRRDAEPVLVEDTDFYTPEALPLVDFRPKLDIISRLDTASKQVCFNYVTGVLLQSSSRTVRSALKVLVQNGVDEFLQRVPGLRDPRRGGKPNLTDLRVRSLPVDLFVDLAIAFESWPFRPELVEMEQRSLGADMFSSSERRR